MIFNKKAGGIIFHKSVLTVRKHEKQVVQTVIQPILTNEEKMNKAREFLKTRGIKDIKPLYASI